MRYVNLRGTVLKVSAVSFGTWAFGGDWGAVDAEEGTASIHRAHDLGINLFDTAQGYGFGAAERLLGQALWQRARREDVVIATKGGLRMEGDTLLRDASAKWLREGAEASLRNLGTDYIDLYQIHWPDPRTPAEETVKALDQLVTSGKVRYVGVSNYDVQQMEALRSLGWRPCSRRTTCSTGP
jgi:aryl-alcohol dehydrogenase-like predicted oxidoreductase